MNADTNETAGATQPAIDASTHSGPAAPPRQESFLRWAVGAFLAWLASPPRRARETDFLRAEVVRLTLCLEHQLDRQREESRYLLGELLAVHGGKRMSEAQVPPSRYESTLPDVGPWPQAALPSQRRREYREADEIVDAMVNNPEMIDEALDELSHDRSAKGRRLYKQVTDGLRARYEQMVAAPEPGMTSGAVVASTEEFTLTDE